jgi:hypothetical protein
VVVRGLKDKVAGVVLAACQLMTAMLDNLKDSVGPSELRTLVDQVRQCTPGDFTSTVLKY